MKTRSFPRLAGLLSAAGLGVFTTVPLPAQEPAAPVAEKQAGTRDKGQAHLERITREPWAEKWKAASLTGTRLVPQKPDQTYGSGLPPVWCAQIAGPEGATGCLMWDSTGGGRLVEFTLDAALTVNSPNARAIIGIPALQQFALERKNGKPVASGCVPTSGASVAAWWISHGQPGWRGTAGSNLPHDLCLRLRNRLEMQTIPDTDGFTSDGMDLAGAMPEDLARALQLDADEHHVTLKIDFQRFQFETLKAEINAGRPVLLSCLVRLPHKPDLSWGHAVAGAGWATLDGVNFTGIVDNFFPVKNPAAVRWVRSDSFDSLTTLRPLPAPEKPASR